MEAVADVEQLIYIVKERNRYLAALKEIYAIASEIDSLNNAKDEFNQIAELCKKASASPRKISREVDKALSRLTLR